MRRFLIPLVIFILMIFALPTLADIVPMSSKAVKHYGIGLLNMPKSYTVYQYPYADAKVIREVNYENLKRSAIVNTIDMRKVSYIAYAPQNDVAFLAVELNPGNNWYCVYIDQEKGETGWVYDDNEDDFFTYRRLFYKYGKPFGVRYFNDLAEEAKSIHAQPSKKSQILDSVKYPRFISFTIIHGNWMLASVNDMGQTTKIGWIKWRNNNGTLNMFPNFSEQPK